MSVNVREMLLIDLSLWIVGGTALLLLIDDKALCMFAFGAYVAIYREVLEAYL